MAMKSEDNYEGVDCPACERMHFINRRIGKPLGIGTGTVQRVLIEQPRPFDVDVAEAAFASQ